MSEFKPFEFPILNLFHDIRRCVWLNSGLSISILTRVARVSRAFYEEMKEYLFLPPNFARAKNRVIAAECKDSKSAYFLFRSVINLGITQWPGVEYLTVPYSGRPHLVIQISLQAREILILSQSSITGEIICTTKTFVENTWIPACIRTCENVYGVGGSARFNQLPVVEHIKKEIECKKGHLQYI